MAQARSQPVAAKKTMSPSAICRTRGQLGLFRFGEKLEDGRLPFAFFGLDEGEAFRAEGLGDVLEVFHFALRDVGEALRVEGLDHAAGLHRAGRKP